MEVEGSPRGLQIHDLLLECANRNKDVSDISDEIINFAQSDAAPDAPVLSDLLLDTLFLYDSGVSCDDEETLTAQRGRLGQLISKLIAGQCIIEQDAYERLDAPLLHAAGLIPDAKAFEKRHVRINTNLLYKQQKFNLFREDNEGYSKLVVEFEAFLESTANVASDEKAQLLLTNIQSLIGYFDLDPNRVLDVLIELVALNLLSHWRFLLPTLKLSPWFVDDGQDFHAEASSRGNIDKRHGSRAAAQIIGFKFQQVKQSEDESEELTMLAALLIKEGLLKLQDLWPHLSPGDSILNKEKSAYQDRVLDQVDKAKGRNALAMAGGLDDEAVPSTSTTQAQKMDVDEPRLVRKDNQQKIALLFALLNVGALPESLFVLSEFSFLINSHAHLAEAYCRLLEQMIEPLWAQLRPQQGYSDDIKNNLQQLKRIPEELKYRDSALVLPKPAKVVHVLDPRRNVRTASIQELFFYDQAGSQLTLCDSYETFESQVLPLIRLAGVQLYRNVKLCTKVAKLGKAAICASPDSDATRQVWQSVLRTSLIPALSLLDTNPAIVNDIFNLISEYSTEQRYSMYGEWFTDSYKKIPELRVQFIKTEKETKSLLRRISKTNTKEYGRRLAKTSHSNPCIVLNIALNQIESYDNLVDVVIEASRYFTLLTFDVLVFVMLTLLSNTQKRRLKEDGTSVAHWLQSLSSFTAKIFKRYSHMDPSPIAIYVAKQLKMNNAFDLIILRDLINEMAGLRPTSDLSEDQLQGCAGGPCLRIEALLLINERRDPSGKAPLRLLHALEKAKLSFAFPILIGQQRTQCVYKVAEEQSLLKLLANLADEVHQILLQYLEFLTLNTTSEHYAAAILSVAEMVHTNGLEPCVAFMIARPAISAALQEHFKSMRLEASRSANPQTEHEYPHETMQSSNHSGEESMEVTTNDSGKMADTTSLDPMQIDTEADLEDTSGSPYSKPPVLVNLTESMETMLASSVRPIISSALYTSFWSFSLYDLVVPSKRYEKEIETLQRQVDLLSSGEPDAQAHKAQLSQITALREEHAAQKHNSRMVSHFFELEHSTWHADSSESKDIASQGPLATVQAFLQHCLLPRCLISPNDATYCAEFVIKLQAVQMQGLDFMLLYENLFGAHLATSIFCCTEREAENLGRFLGRALEKLNVMSSDEAAFNEMNTRSVPSDPLKATDAESNVDSSPWSLYKTTWYDLFHRSIWSSIKACFESREYMHIRNTLIVLEKMQNAFPLFKWIGKNIDKEVDKIISTERREDLKIRALGYKAVLKRQQSKWLDPPGKPVIQKSEMSFEAQQSQGVANIAGATSVVDSSTPVNVKANESVSEGALNPEIDTFEPSAQQVPAQVADVTRSDSTTSPSMLEQQKEKAKQKAASLSQHLKEQAQTSVRSEKEVAQTQNDANKADVESAGDSLARKRGTISRSGSRAASPRRSDRAIQSDTQPRSGDRHDRARAPYNGSNVNERDTTSKAARSRAPLSDRTTREETTEQARRGNPDRAVQPPIDDRHGRSGDSQQRRGNPEDYGRLSSDRYGAEDRRRPARAQDSRAPYDSSRTARSVSNDVPSGPRSESLKDRMGSQPPLQDSLHRKAKAEQSYDRIADRDQHRNGDSRKERSSDNVSDRTTESSTRPARRDPEESGDRSRRNAPDGPRQVGANGRGSREPSNAANPQIDTQGPFIHPDRQPTSSGSATAQGRSFSTGPSSEDRSHRPERASVAPEPVVHPSRMGSVQASQGDRGRDETQRPVRPNSGAPRGPNDTGPGSLRQSSLSGPDNYSSGRGAGFRGDTRETRGTQPAKDENYRGPRDIRASGRESRVDLRSDPRPQSNSDGRNARMDRNQERGDANMGRLQPERATRNEPETKRRYNGDQRDQRATKRR